MANDFNLFYFYKEFPDEDAYRKYLEERFWNNIPKCPYCGNVQKIYRHKDGKLFRCANMQCKKQFKVTTETIYENSNIPPQKWFLTFYLFVFIFLQ